MPSYYAARAPIYDELYESPEYRDDLRRLEGWLPHVPAERRRDFLVHFATRLAPEALLLMIDQLAPPCAAAFTFR